MKFHIVRDGETVREIMFLYSITEDELKEENRHIRAWDKLIPGTKLKVPVLAEADDNDILQMEPFIEDYYPKDINLESEEVEAKKMDIHEEISEEQNNQEIILDSKEKVQEEQLEQQISNEEINEEFIAPQNRIYVNNQGMRNNQRHNIIYYPYYIYYPIYSPYIFNYKKRK